MIENLDQLWKSWVLLAMAGLLALCVLGTLALLSDAGRRLRFEWMGAFFIGVPLALALGVILTQRVVTREELSALLMAPEPGEIATSNWASRIVTLICLALAIERCTRFVLMREWRDARGLGLLTAVLVYIAWCNLVAPIFGTGSGFTHQLFYAPLFAVAVFAYAQNELDRCLRLLRASLLVFVVLSLTMLAIRPEMVADLRYQGLIPGLKLRFYGFATHPNTMAPMCVLLMGVLRLRPLSGWFNAVAWTMAVVALILTQSKTTIALAALGFAALWLWDGIRAARGRGVHEERRYTLAAVSGLLVTFAALVGALLGAIVLTDDFGGRVAAWADRSQLLTLTGRTRIWDLTMDVVSANPLFGYGPQLWGAEFRLKTGMLAITHAHNQYLQTLGAAGVGGLLALLAYFGMLLAAAWRVREASRGVPLMLVLMLLLRGFVEVPMSVSGVIQTEFLMQMSLLAMCVGFLLPREVSAGRPASDPRPLVRSRPVRRWA